MAENVKHTAGPWEVSVSHAGHLCVYPSDKDANKAIAKIEENDEANARLICAAPDLLEALKVAEAAITEACKVAEISGYEAEEGSALAVIRLAIAKATGEAN